MKALNLLSKLRVFILVFLAALANPVRNSAQTAVPAQDNIVNSTNMKPTPGDQRTFNGGLEESVDPGSGNVSISIQAPMPPDRGVSLPVYAWTYNSAGNFNFAPRYGPSYAANNSSAFVSTTGLYLQSSGLPAYLPNSVNSQSPSLSDYVAVGPGAHTITCNPWTHFVYTDSSGGNHPLGLYHINPSEDKTDGCGHWGLSGGNYQGGDEFYRATLDPQTLVVTIKDLHGNKVAASNPNQSQPPQTEDTNGNLGKGTGNDANLAVDAQYGGLQYSSLTVPGVSGSYSYTYATSALQGVTITAKNTSDGGGCLASATETYSTRSNSTPVLTRLTLPDQRFYTFEYDPAYGRISKITYPTGATVKYTWQIVSGMEDLSARPFLTNTSSGSAPATCDYKYDWPAIQKREISYDGVNVARSEDYSYSVTRGTNQIFWSSRVVTVTTSDYLKLQTDGKPTKSIVVHTYGPGGQYGEPATLGTLQTTVPAETSTQYQDGSGTTLRTVYRTWASPKLLSAECIVLDDGSMSGTFYQYQASPTNSFPLGNVTDVAEYEFGKLNGTCTQPSSGSPTRETVTSYAAFSAPAYASTTPAILDRPASVKKYSKGTLAAETDYSYDETATSAVGAINHDDANYPAGMQARGNVTKITSKCLRSCIDVVHSYTYDQTGQRLTDTVGGHTTTYSYADSFVSSQSQPSGNTNAYVTKVTRPATAGQSHIESFSYNFGSGTLNSHTDENSKVTSLAYVDTWNRQTEADYPDGGVTSTSYSDAGPNPSVSQSQSLDGSRKITRQTTFNGVGLRIKDALTSDPSGTVTTDYTVDGFGRTIGVTNPYRSTAGGSTTISYDALGRKLTQTNPDSTTKQWSYSGSQTTFTDEAANSWSQTLDGLGRMVTVSEPGGNITTYTYDGLDNLLTADQWGTSTVGSAGGGSRSRSFTYDSLSRLITSKNPETGTVCYGTWSGTSVGSGTCRNGYDASGNLLAKTDARGMGILYTYDALNRLQTKAYSSPTYQDGAVKTYYYDGSRADGGPAGTGLNQIGRLSSARSWAPFGNGLHDEYQSYDVMGRVTARTEVAQSESGTGGHSIGMAYDLAGNLTSLTYPDGRVVTQGYDSAGRLNSVTDGGGQKYVSSVSYFPNGTPQQMLFSNDNMSEYTSLNSRLQVCETKIGNGGGPGTLFDRQYFYGSDTTSGNQCNDVTTNNGNIMHVLDSMNSTNSQHYTYDSLNRLTHWNGFNPAGTVRQQSFGYDSFGNMAPAASATAPSVTGLFDANNRLVAQTTSDCLSYDAAGNLTCTGTQNTDAHTYGFNEEGELVLAWVAQNSTSNLVGQYSFDSSGTRVRSDNPTAHTWREYTYFNGQVLAEKDNTGNWTDHIYENGKHLAMVQSSVPELHIHGQRDAQHVNMGCGTNWWTDGMGGPGYTVRSGDRWFFRHKNAGAVAGMQLQLTDGSFGWQHGLVDQNGVGVELLGDTSGAFATRVIDLNPIAGMTIARTLVDINNQTPAGTYDVFYREASIVSADGTVTPIFNGQAVPGSIWDGCGVYNRSFGVEPTTATGAEAATYYAGDQVGTVQMELSSAAWPVARHEFAPFGQQLDTQPTQNRYKFTGKERDTESGLDYFGARYYGSTIGRFLSADDGSDQSPQEPQSWNLYSYVRNTPLIGTDPDGHNYAVCPAGVSTISAVCRNISDKDFEAEQAKDQANGVRFSQGTIYQHDANGNLVKSGTYRQTDVDLSGDAVNNQAGLNTLATASRGVATATAIVGIVYGIAGAAIIGSETAAATIAARSNLIFRLERHGIGLINLLRSGHNVPLAETQLIKNAIATAVAAGAISSTGETSFEGIVQVAGTFVRFTGANTPAGTVISNVMGNALQK